MENAEEQLTAIGFARNRREPIWWRSVRLGGPVSETGRAGTAPDPACSRPLLRWRELLARSPVAPSYRISRADG
jgi:hypothetical protein